MSRHSTTQSYGHRITIDCGDYILNWKVDRYYRGSRIRHPKIYSRITNQEGAKRFAKKWRISMPEMCRDCKKPLIAEVTFDGHDRCSHCGALIWHPDEVHELGMSNE